MGTAGPRKVQVFSSEIVEDARLLLTQKTSEPAPQPASYTIGGIVRAVFPELCELRKRGYSLNMLVRIFEENGVRITATALSGYMKKLNGEAEKVSANEIRKAGTQPSTSDSQSHGHLAMKPDVPL